MRPEAYIVTIENIKRVGEKEILSLGVYDVVEKAKKYKLHQPVVLVVDEFNERSLHTLDAFNIYLKDYPVGSDVTHLVFN